MPDLELVFNEEGTWEERPEPYITVEIETEEDYALLQKAIDHYHKHGRWIHTAIEDDTWGGTFHKWTCSICDFSTGNNPTGSNYCSNCGADMREGKENEGTDD